MWMEDKLNEINNYLNMMKNREEAARAERYRDKIQKVKVKKSSGINRNKYEYLDESLIWSRTKEEDMALFLFEKKIHGYSPVNIAQSNVILFANKSIKKKFLELKGDYTGYLRNTLYWKSKFVNIKTPNGEKTQINYALNEEMKCVIFEYSGKIIISTQSSFENYINEIENKPLVHKNQFNEE